MPAIITPTLQFRANSIIEYASYDYYDCSFKRNRQDEFSSNLLNTYEFSFFNADCIQEYTLSAKNESAATAMLLNLFPDAEILTINKEKKTYTGKMCEGAKKRLRKALDQLIEISPLKYVDHPDSGEEMPYRLGFITLTISQHELVDINEAKRVLLAPFLQWMRRSHKCSYVWKAEFQQRGMVHFHITCNGFIHYREVRDKWNYLQKKNGYLSDYYRDFGQFKAPGSEYDAPSTDIQCVRHVGKMGSYMIKQVDKDINLMAEYMKDCQNESSVEGKVWDCSFNLKKSKRFETVSDYEYVDELETMVEQGEVFKIVTDSCTIYSFRDKLPTIVLKEADLFRYKEYLKVLQDVEEPGRHSKKVYELPPIAARIVKKAAQLNLFSSS